MDALLAIGFAFGMLLWGLLAVAVCADATVNSSHRALIWGAATFVGGPLGVIVYAFVGRDGGSQSYAATTDATDPYEYTHKCTTCGKRYQAPATDEIATCRRCGGVDVSRVTPRS